MKALRHSFLAPALGLTLSSCTTTTSVFNDTDAAVSFTLYPPAGVFSRLYPGPPPHVKYRAMLDPRESVVCNEAIRFDTPFQNWGAALVVRGAAYTGVYSLEDELPHSIVIGPDPGHIQSTYADGPRTHTDVKDPRSRDHLIYERGW